MQSATSLAEAAEVFGAPIDPAGTRRNLTISHGEVPRAPGERLRIGDVLLEVVRVAAPCKLLDDTLGRGAQVALRRRGGSIFRVLEGGEIQLGDTVEPVESVSVHSRSGRASRGRPGTALPPRPGETQPAADRQRVPAASQPGEGLCCLAHLGCVDTRLLGVPR